MRRAVAMCAFPVDMTSAPWGTEGLRILVRHAVPVREYLGQLSFVPPSAPAGPARHVRTTSKTFFVTPPPAPVCTATCMLWTSRRRRAAPPRRHSPPPLAPAVVGTCRPLRVASHPWRAAVRPWWWGPSPSASAASGHARARACRPASPPSRAMWPPPGSALPIWRYAIALPHAGPYACRPSRAAAPRHHQPRPSPLSSPPRRRRRRPAPQS
eukprot:scaffold35935_cov81-Phaeocystis_antarctica.AAC.1